LKISRVNALEINIDKTTKIITSSTFNNPPWKKSEYKINLKMTQFNKNSTSHDIIRRTFSEILDNYTSRGYEVIYTDGSKTEHGYGAAVVKQNTTFTYKCHDYSTVYTTELFALQKALKHRSTNKTLICTDSLSVVLAIQNSQNKNSLVRQIQDKLRETEKETTIMWIPSHTGIKGNEEADKKAKEATTKRYYTQYNILPEDVTKHIKEHAKQDWQHEWEGEIRRGNKLGNIKQTVEKWENLNSYDRKDQTVITRLRIGHTRLTHIHLIEKKDPPQCTCNENLTVKHIFECTNYINAINKYSINYDTLKLDSKDDTDKILNYLKEVQLYDHI